jgi:hypothetical protein
MDEEASDTANYGTNLIIRSILGKLIERDTGEKLGNKVVIAAMVK